MNEIKRQLNARIGDTSKRAISVQRKVNLKLNQPHEVKQVQWGYYAVVASFIGVLLFSINFIPPYFNEDLGNLSEPPNSTETVLPPKKEEGFDLSLEEKNFTVEDNAETVDQFYNNLGLKNTIIPLEAITTDKYQFENEWIKNGEVLMLLSDEQGIPLEKGNHVSIDINVVQDGLTGLAFGYVHNGKYTELFSDSITDKLSTDFKVLEDGNYVFCIIGFTAGRLNISDGNIQIDK